MDEPRAGAPAWMLILTGIIDLIYSLIYAVWTSLPIALFLFAQIGIVMDGKQGFIEAIVNFFILTMVPLIQLVGFLITAAMSAVIVLGGLRLNVYRSKGVAWLAVLCAIFLPFLAFAVNAGSALNISTLGMGCITGCLLGNIPTLLLLLLGLVSGGVGAATLSSATTAERYAANLG